MKKLYSPTFADWPCPFEVRCQVGLAARWPLDGARYADTNRYKQIQKPRLISIIRTIDQLGSNQSSNQHSE